ncbi:extracellular solute-binding protein [Saccharopolyspora sp. K220]|uniref:extracellular solute-binding protein n=1 Tax=Saccharopolyspora soli TaxID=2926618 RepID=UPI001F59A015|nr:extracellular solute-binding protein [Saccharopolyspora soli]MCI2417003.1 extracellular solute-binding protein [Saccharopolyspora soli]
MSRTRSRFALAALSVAVLALSGCGGAGPSGESDNTLTIWMMTGGPGDSPLVQDVNAEFARQHPGVQVHVEIQQWDNIVTKLTTALATNNPPDIVEMGNTQTPLQTYSGGLAELDRNSFEDSANWLSGLAAPSEYDGKLYATPLYGGTKVVMYNKELFAAAGITEPPKTIEQLEQDCRVLAAKNTAVPNFSGFYMPGEYWFAGVPFLFGKGANVAKQSDGKWTATMSDAKSVEGLQAWQNFQNTCSTPSSVGVNTTDPDQTQIFADGKAAMLYVKAWEPASVLEKNPALADKIGFFPMPGFTADASLPVIVSGSTIGIATNSPDQALAKDWLRIITSKTFQQKMAQQLNLLPIVPGFLPAEGVPEQLTVAAQASGHSFPLPNSPGEATLENERYNEQFFSKIASGADIAQSAAEYDKHATDVFNKQGG